MMWLCCVDEFLLNTLELERGDAKPREPQEMP